MGNLMLEQAVMYVRLNLCLGADADNIDIFFFNKARKNIVNRFIVLRGDENALPLLNKIFHPLEDNSRLSRSGRPHNEIGILCANTVADRLHLTGGRRVLFSLQLLFQCRQIGVKESSGLCFTENRVHILGGTLPRTNLFNACQLNITDNRRKTERDPPRFIQFLKSDLSVKEKPQMGFPILTPLVYGDNFRRAGHFIHTFELYLRANTIILFPKFFSNEDICCSIPAIIVTRLDPMVRQTILLRRLSSEIVLGICIVLSKCQLSLQYFMRLIRLFLLIIFFIHPSIGMECMQNILNVFCGSHLAVFILVPVNLSIFCKERKSIEVLGCDINNHLTDTDRSAALHHAIIFEKIDLTDPNNRKYTLIIQNTSEFLLIGIQIDDLPLFIVPDKSHKGLSLADFFMYILLCSLVRKKQIEMSRNLN